MPEAVRDWMICKEHFHCLPFSGGYYEQPAWWRNEAVTFASIEADPEGFARTMGYDKELAQPVKTDPRYRFEDEEVDVPDLEESIVGSGVDG